MSDDRSVHANILAGPDVQLLEMSRRDLLLESDVRLTPGAGICLNVSIDKANYLAGGRVTRVDATLSGGRVKYRAAVALDNDMPAFERPAATTTRTEASRAPSPGAAEDEPMDAAQEQQILKTALRSAEAHRKELAEQVQALQAERSKWDEQRKAFEQRVAAAEHKVDAAARQLNAGKDSARQAEQALAARHAKEEGAWQGERKVLQEALAAAEATAKQAAAQLREGDARLKDLEARLKDAETRSKNADAGMAEAGKRLKDADLRLRDADNRLTDADIKLKQADARLAEINARAKAADARAAELEARLKAADAKAASAEARATATDARLTATDAKLTATDAKLTATVNQAAASDARARETQARADQLARELTSVQEREKASAAGHTQAQDAWRNERTSLQDRLKSTDARVAQLTADLAASRDAEQRLQKRIKEEEAKLLDLVQENERQIEEIEGVRAALVEAEQAAARYEQDRQSWTTQKERLTSRLQLTEKWCADQQDLLYALQQQLGGAITLLDGWKPAALDAQADADPKAAKNGRKASA